MTKKKNYKYLVPELVSYDNELIYKELAKEFGLTKVEISYIVRTNFWFFRKFVNEHSTKGENINFANLGKFKVYKSVDTEEQRDINNKITAIISRYIQLHINEDDVELLRGWNKEGFHIPYRNDIFVNGRRRIRKQKIAEDIKLYLPADYFIKNNAVWLEKPIEPIDPKDSVMEKFKDQEFGKDEFDSF